MVWEFNVFDSHRNKSISSFKCNVVSIVMLNCTKCEIFRIGGLDANTTLLAVSWDALLTVDASVGVADHCGMGDGA